MRLFGLTGGIAMGKSTVAGMLRDRGWSVVDTDELAREAVEPGQPALAEVARVFGPRLLDDSGSLRRSELARIVFADAAARRRLEEILHPRIRELWLRQVEGWRIAGRPVGVVVIPLLFETGAVGQFEAVVCAACSPCSQRERLSARGWGPAEATARVEAQWPVERKMAMADYVCWTEGPLGVTADQVDCILRQLNLHPSF